MLFILNKNNCIARMHIENAAKGDIILLIEEAVYAAIENNQPRLASDAKVYALEPDMQARGITAKQCQCDTEYVDYNGFVELVATNNPVRSAF
ncbi:MAG: hypothetical protein A6F72_08735 [Cycloclasticus sp. symbiont of Poecilosclerida sp. N]|nr:MAG: hypothetical protein A6F72_08735 [Cycloclasticus sp. symbiont of Poecilosclerida sp. N]